MSLPSGFLAPLAEASQRERKYSSTKWIRGGERAAYLVVESMPSILETEASRAVWKSGESVLVSVAVCSAVDGSEVWGRMGLGGANAADEERRRAKMMDENFIIIVPCR